MQQAMLFCRGKDKASDESNHRDGDEDRRISAIGGAFEIAIVLSHGATMTDRQ